MNAGLPLLIIAVVVGVAAGAIVGIVVGAAYARRVRRLARRSGAGDGRRSDPVGAGAAGGSPTGAGAVVPAENRTDQTAAVAASTAGERADQADLARRSLHFMRTGVVVLDAADEVMLANRAARRMGVVREARVTHSVLRTLARQVRQSPDGLDEGRDAELDLPRGRSAEPLAVRVRVAQIGLGDYVVLQVEDITEAHRVHKVRRDFVANVSHELKTPVGALQLLAEAVLDATDDPEAVRRFAKRMRRESTRLGKLIQEIIDLSKLQGADPLPEPNTVYVDRVVSEVLDRTRMGAEAQHISVVAGGERGLTVQGSEDQLVNAVTNLVDNAINYSPDRTRVAIGTRRREHLVEISVSDQGIGIGESDLDRIFERFYRSDPARSRATGGTGLGLAIVKHIATNHGGSVDVWSVEGSGSTFTLRLPRPPEDSGPPPTDRVAAPDRDAPDGGASDRGALDRGASDRGASDLGTAELGTAELGTADLGAAGPGASALGASGLGTADRERESHAAGRTTAGRTAGGQLAERRTADSRAGARTEPAGGATAGDGRPDDGRRTDESRR